MDSKTPNDLVYCELRRYPITINMAINCIRYWIKLTQMEQHRLPKRAYNTLYRLDQRGKETWVTKVRLCLLQNGFGYAWINQGVGNIKLFLKTVKNRLVDCRWQNVYQHINTSERFLSYSLICEKYNVVPVYISSDVKRHLKNMMTKFRFGVSEINVHRQRYKTYNQSNFQCPFCKSLEENEVHFVLRCPLYNEARTQYIKPKYYRMPSVFKLNILLCTKK